MDKEKQDAQVIVLKFADSAIPKFKEVRGKDYIAYGEDNKYPEYLTYLFDKSAKHNAILTGKANYIFGKGFENGDFTINRLGESLNDISKKAILDIEIYGGFRLECIWNKMGRISEVYHVDYSTIRVGKEGGFYFKETWEKFDRDELVFMSAFDPGNPVGSQIYAYNEYRPMVRFYPLPSYIGCNNYVETDIEISKFYLSSIRNGMMPSKMLQFFDGEPTEEAKGSLEKALKKKFTGAEAAGSIMVVFNNGPDQKVDVSDLSGTDLDKMFIELNKTAQQEIYAGHGITSPMLFGIKTEGQLGGATELRTAYEIFLNTYAGPKSVAYAKEVTYMLETSMFPGLYELKATDPIGLQFDVKDVIDSLPTEFIFEKLGIPKEMWGGIIPSIPGAAPIGDGTMVNENIKNLTGKQNQNVHRIIREFTNGKITEQHARAMLRLGYGLTEEDISSILGIRVAALSYQYPEQDIIAMFDECGESKNDFEILRSKKVSFTLDEIEDDEAVYAAFKTFDVTTTEKAILELIKKDPKITPKVISQAIGETEAYVKSKLANLTKKGLIESTSELIGEDEVIVRSVPKGADLLPPPGKAPPTQIFVKYSYEGPQDAKNRPFCAKMMELNRLYSRADIEKISARLGYSVFDRRGGFWTRKGTNDTTPYCRHKWQSNIVVVKKGGSNVS